MQTVVVRDFLMEHEVFNLLSAGELAPEALSDGARSRIEKLRHKRKDERRPMDNHCARATFGDRPTQYAASIRLANVLH